MPSLGSRSSPPARSPPVSSLLQSTTGLPLVGLATLITFAIGTVLGARPPVIAASRSERIGQAELGELSPGFSQAHFNRGTLLHERKQWEGALASYDRAIETNSEYAEAYCSRGVLLTQLRQFDAAMANLKRCITELRNRIAELSSV